MSIPIRKKIPIKKPITAGANENAPKLSLHSIAGIIKLQTDEAIITPPAKPFSILPMLEFMFFLSTNTQALPRVVPIKGIIMPCIISDFISITIAIIC